MKSRIAAAIIAAAAVLGLSGCNLVAPQDTTIQYDPSDGVSADIGAIALRNVVVVTSDGEVGNLVFSAVSGEAAPQRVTIQHRPSGAAPADLAVEVQPGRNGFGFGEAPQVQLRPLGAPAGALTEVYFQYGNHQGALLQVPVLNTCLPEYAALAPTEQPAEPEQPADGEGEEQPADAEGEESADADAEGAQAAARAEQAAQPLPAPIDPCERRGPAAAAH